MAAWGFCSFRPCTFTFYLILLQVALLAVHCLWENYISFVVYSGREMVKWAFAMGYSSFSSSFFSIQGFDSLYIYLDGLFVLLLVIFNTMFWG